MGALPNLTGTQQGISILMGYLMGYKHFVQSSQSLALSGPVQGRRGTAKVRFNAPRRGLRRHSQYLIWAVSA